MNVPSFHPVIVFVLVVLVFMALLREWLLPDPVAPTAMGFTGYRHSRSVSSISGSASGLR
jgi:hypothetical protein